MAGIHNDEEPIADINVTPLVDVMLVLLIIFMVTATYIAQRAIPVNLPKAVTGESSSESKNLGFSLDAHSMLYFNGEKIDFMDIGPKIDLARVSAGESDHLQALITADESVPHGLVVKLIDSIRKNGVSDFAINVESVEKIVH